MSLDHCAELLAKGDPERFRTVLAAPLPARVVLLPLYAVNLELARAPWTSAEPMVGAMRLQWWRERFDALGKGEGAPAGHPVLGPLAAGIGGDEAAAALLDAMAAARWHDLGAEPFADAAALMDHLDATAGNLMWLAARSLGAPDTAEAVVRAFGMGAGLAAWLRAVPELAARGRRPLPPDTDIAALAHEGLAGIARARAARAAVPARARPALWPGWPAARLLHLAAREPERVGQGGLALSDMTLRGGLLWAVTTGRW
ncbi:MAG: squalene/phytoene synthase family protein [Gemmobacter sp.]